MKVFVFLSVCISLTLGCSNPLPKLAACNLPGGDCSCQAGLTCKLTKEIIYQGERVSVKQCMPTDEEIEVEIVDLDNQSADSPRYKRLLSSGIGGFFQRCSHESECRKNFCCLFGRRCAPKILKYLTCSLTALHNCGCRDGLECRETASFTLPISGRKVTISQCLDPEV